MKCVFLRFVVVFKEVGLKENDVMFYEEELNILDILFLFINLG